MSWFKRDKPAEEKLPKLEDKDRRVRTEGLWQKCEGCRQITWKKDLEDNWNVCPKCGRHNQIGALARLRLLLDDGEYTEFDAALRSSDPLGFVDNKSYRDKLKEAERATQLPEAVVAAEGKLAGRVVQVLSLIHI